ncbi:conserved hypothetical protein [Frankia sp. AiPs1]|uniref:hypothetical protein n=1 Tax=Frankia sp. AiPa1 TaxID=573492 RepID=UPI00202AD33B|nr:hypothetical protein [Frankia sp. AiPa1]MCL9760538.1 hypothetical protein [Frankia sp. AiPa1]
MIFRRRSGAAEGDTRQAGPGGDPRGGGAGGGDVPARVRQLREELAALVTRVNADGGRLPPGVVPTVRDIDDILRPLLLHVERQSASDEEMRGLTAIIHEYLPQALDDFTALPPQYADRPGVTGTTAAEDLVRQLQLLDEGAGDLQDLVYTGDAAQLAIQARFLDAKFRRSDLD